MSDPLAEARELAAAGEHERVIAACRKAGALGPEARELLSSSHEALGDFEEAAKQMQKAASGSADPSVLCRAGELWYKAGKHAKAANEAGKALKTSPGDPAATALKARALISQDRHAEALKCCGPEPSDPRVQAAAGRALYETGKTKEAAKMCKLALAAPGFSARFYAGLAAEGAEAKKHMASSLDEPRDADSPGARTGRALQVLGRAQDALKVLDDDPKSACIRGQILQELGQQKEALEAFKRSTKGRAQNSEDMYHAAVSCYNLGLDGDASWHQKAKKTLKDARARNPGIPGAQELAHDIDEQIVKRREADEVKLAPRPKPVQSKPKPVQKPARKKAKKPKPPRPALPDASEIIRKANMFCAPGECRKALDVLEDLSAADASRADAQFCKGTAYYGLAKYEEAHTCFERAAGRESSLKHQYWRASSLFRQGRSGMLEAGFNTKVERYREAKSLLDKITSADPLYPGARTLMGLVEYNISNTIKTSGRDDSARSFREALKIDPSDAVALYHLGQACEHDGRAAEANRLYDQAIQAKPDASGFLCEPLYCRGYALDLCGQHEQALTQYLEALARDPDYGPGFAEQASRVRGQEWQRRPAYKDLEVWVVDTNVALPHLARSELGRDLPGWADLAYHRRRFWDRLQDGSYVIPEVCKTEILRTLKDMLPRHVREARLIGAVITGVRATLDGLPRTRWTEAAESVKPDDVMRVRRAYWLAWFRMHPQKKAEWTEKKRKGRRPLAGGPPLGINDTKILAVAAKLASGSRGAGLVTGDNDFLVFRGMADELGVRIVNV